MASPLHHLLAVALHICAFSLIRAQSLEEIFDIAKDSTPGACTQDQISTLSTWFQEMLDMNNNAMETLKNEYNTNYETRKLASSLFAIDPRTLGDREGAGYDYSPEADSRDDERLKKVLDWFKDTDYYLKDIPTDGRVQTRLYCNSDVLAWKIDTDPYLNDRGEEVKDNGRVVTTEEGLGDVMNDNWVWWEQNQNSYILSEKSRYPANPDWNNNPAPNGPNGRPDYCSEDGQWGWTINGPTDKEDGLPSSDLTNLIILCPKTFLRQGLKAEIDLTEQDGGTNLDDMEPMSLTWYHEMFHLGKEPGLEPPNDSSDAKDLTEAEGWDPEELAWLDTKGGYEFTANNIAGGVSCMLLSWYDRATPVLNINANWAVKNPETYAWFGLASYMTNKGDAKQSWSIGRILSETEP